MIDRTLIGGAFALSALVLALGQAAASTSGHPGTPAEELKYQGAPVAMDPGATKDLIDGDGPPMTKVEFDDLESRWRDAGFVIHVTDPDGVVRHLWVILATAKLARVIGSSV